MSSPVRVLVIDDSALMRKLISQMLEKDPSIEVAGTAMDGEFGLKCAGIGFGDRNGSVSRTPCFRGKI